MGGCASLLDGLLVQATRPEAGPGPFILTGYWAIKRRLRATNGFPNYLGKPIDEPEHEALRRELWIGGADIACYYLSMLTGRDDL
jgi:hypothetical protein